MSPEERKLQRKKDLQSRFKRILKPHQDDAAEHAIVAIQKYGGFILADGIGSGGDENIL